MMFSKLWVVMLALALPAAARAEWSQATSDHFVVYADMKPEATRVFTQKLEDYDATLRILTGFAKDESPNKLQVFVVRSPEVVQRQLGKSGRNVAGVYIPVITGALAIVPRAAGNGGEYDLNADTVLFHEYTHHFMLQHFATGYPAWYVEGFAEFLSTIQFRPKRQIAVGLPAKHRFYELALGESFPLTRMFAIEPGKMTPTDTSSFYAYAWLLTHFLSFTPERKGQLKQYLAAFAAGTDPVEAATDAFGDIEALQKALKKYRDGSSLTYRLVTTNDRPKATIDVSALDVADSALMPLYLRFARGSRGPEEVASFAADARLSAAKYPGNPRALEMLAEGELDAKALDAATTANDALIALKPGDGRALLRRARIAAASLKDSHDPAAWLKVRQLITKANRAAPDDPFPLLAYYNSFGSARLPAPVLAVDGLWRALQLSPQTQELRFLLANQMMNDKAPDKARAVLAPVLNEPHSAETRQAARAILAGDPAEAERLQKKQDNQPDTPKGS